MLDCGWKSVLHEETIRTGWSADARATCCWFASARGRSNIGAFVMPYGWGIARDATGNFQAGFMALTAATVLLGALIFLLRSRVFRAQTLTIPA